MFSKKQKSYFALFIICFVWGTTWVISKIVVKDVSVMQLCGMRQLVAGLFMVTYFSVGGSRLPAKTDWPRLIMMSMLMFVMANGMSTWGITYIESGLGAIIGSTTAFWIPVFVWWIMRKNVFNTKVVIGLIAGIAGIVIIFSEKLGRSTNPNFLFGIFLSLSATIAWSVATVLAMKKKDSARLYSETGWQMLISAVVFLPLTALLGQWTPLAAIPAHTWGYISYLTLAGSILTFISYVYAIKHLPPAQLAIYPYINPIVAVLLGMVMLNEPVSTVLIAGAAVTLTGVYLVNSGSKRKEKDAAAVEVAGSGESL